MGEKIPLLQNDSAVTLLLMFSAVGKNYKLDEAFML